MLCRRCSSADLLALEVFHPQDNRVYRCRQCGFLFSPGPAAAVGPERETAASRERKPAASRERKPAASRPAAAAKPAAPARPIPNGRRRQS